MAPLPNSRTEPDGSAIIRVLSYNIRSLRDDTDALARIIRACAPDLVLIQEAPFLPLAQETGPPGSRVRPRRPRRRRHRRGPRPAVLAPGDRRALGGRTPPLTPGEHRRGFATAVVRIGGTRLGVLSCHLSLRQDERYEQGGMLLDRLAGMGVDHVIAGGDLNDRPDGRTFERLAKELQDCWATAPWGEEYTWTPATPSSASTRSSPRTASRCSAAGYRSACPVSRRQT